MRKNIEPQKDKNGKVKDGLHHIGEIAVDSGQIALADPCNFNKGPDITISTNFGDGMFPVYEDWENNKRLALYIPLDTDLHLMLKDMITDPTIVKKQRVKARVYDPPSYKKDNLKPGEFNPKDIGIDGYKYIEDMEEDYK